MNLKQYLPENWVKMNWNQIKPFSSQISTKSWQNSKKIDQKWDKNKNNGFGVDGQNLIIKLANFERKSMKNQWKLNEISGKIITKL